MTVSASYFDHMYAASPDPWGFTSRWYETRKHAITMAMLPKPHYRDAFEPGCSIGVLSDLLAPRCEHLLCCDIAPAAVKAATESTAAHPQVQVQVQVQQRALPQGWPEGQFDLIVLSEINLTRRPGSLVARSELTTDQIASPRCRAGGAGGRRSEAE